MGTFFGKFIKYTKEYTRERNAKQKDAYGHGESVLVSTATIRGIMKKQSVTSSMLTSGKGEINYWKSVDVLYCSMEQDVLVGDIIVNGTIRYLVEHIATQDDFKIKNSHKILYLKNLV